MFVFCFVYSPFSYCFVYCFSFRIFVQLYRPLPPGRNLTAENKYHIVILTVNHGTSCTTAVRVLSDRRRRRRRRGVNEVFVLLRCYAANTLVPYSRVKQSKKIGFSETSVTNYRSTLYNIPEELIFHLHRGGSLKSRRKEVSRDLIGHP
jgi:hypothetical protein